MNEALRTAAPELDDEDRSRLAAAMVDRSRRVRPLDLSSGTVWVKHCGDEAPMFTQRLLSLAGMLLPIAFIRPLPKLDGAGLVARESRRIAAAAAAGIAAPPVIAALGSTIVLGDVGATLEQILAETKPVDLARHDALLIGAAGGLGRLHAAGLCHGRPHPRDMFLQGDDYGFMDFEEEPEAVMPLALAQARDLWVLFLQLVDRAGGRTGTVHDAYAAWERQAPVTAIAELRSLLRTMSRLVPLARLIGRIRMGGDLRRFLGATQALSGLVAGQRPL